MRHFLEFSFQLILFCSVSHITCQPQVTCCPIMPLEVNSGQPYHTAHFSALTVFVYLINSCPPTLFSGQTGQIRSTCLYVSRFCVQFGQWPGRVLWWAETPGRLCCTSSSASTMPYCFHPLLQVRQWPHPLYVLTCLPPFCLSASGVFDLSFSHLSLTCLSFSNLSLISVSALSLTSLSLSPNLSKCVWVECITAEWGEFPHSLSLSVSFQRDFSNLSYSVVSLWSFLHPGMGLSFFFLVVIVTYRAVTWHQHGMRRVPGPSVVMEVVLLRFVRDCVTSFNFVADWCMVLSTCWGKGAIVRFWILCLQWLNLLSGNPGKPSDIKC